MYRRQGGAVVLETNVASDPNALAGHLAPYHLKLARLGLESGPLSEWLVRGLERHGFRAMLMETHHVRAALSTRIAKTDRKDAPGMADLLRMGSGQCTSKAWTRANTVLC